MATSSLERIAIVPDLHCGDVDQRAVLLAGIIIADIKPDRIIFLGDLLDSGWASSYPQDQASLKGVLKREVAEWVDVARLLHSAAPDAKMEAIPGNHDYRIIKGFRWAHPEFHAYDDLDLPHVLEIDPEGKLADCNIQWHDNPAAIFLASKHFVVTHGVRIAKHSGGSGMLELAEEWWTSGCSGHTHRLGQVFRTTHSGVYCWTECGHLSKRRPKYAAINKVAPMNWQQGMAIMYAGAKEFRVPDLIPFWFKRGKLRARYGDKEYEA